MWRLLSSVSQTRFTATRARTYFALWRTYQLNCLCRPLANLSGTVRNINMGDSAKEGVTAADADSYFTNKNGYKIFCKYWRPELKDGEKPRYETLDNAVFHIIVIVNT